jgi:hypothetical protein
MATLARIEMAISAKRAEVDQLCVELTLLESVMISTITSGIAHGAPRQMLNSLILQPRFHNNLRVRLTFDLDRVVSVTLPPSPCKSAVLFLAWLNITSSLLDQYTAKSKQVESVYQQISTLVQQQTPVRALLCARRLFTTDNNCSAKAKALTTASELDEICSSVMRLLIPTDPDIGDEEKGF